MGRQTPSQSSATQFATLEPRARHVSEATVKKRWKRLSTASQENVRHVLTSLQKQPVTGSHRVQLRDIALRAAIDEVTDRLIQRLPRMPFPPASHDENFDFEMTLHRIRNAEEQLTNNVHSMYLLRAQIRREEQLLEADKQELDQLQKGLRSNNALRRRQKKNLHHLAQTCGTSPGSVQSESPFVSSATLLTLPEVGFVDSSNDQSLLPMARQLRNHMGSIISNTSKMQVIMDHIDRVSSSLAVVACKTSQDELAESAGITPT